MQRLLTPELMDDPELDPRAHAQALRGLARLNALAASDRILWPSLRKLAKRAKSPLRVLDIATGSADIPIRLARRATREGISVEFHACDISNTALSRARDRADRAKIPIQLLRHDPVMEPFDNQFDVVICSLFVHHLDTGDAERFLRHAAGAAASLLLVSDLRRGPGGLAVAWAASRLATRSRIVHTDATKSVRAAYTPSEFAALAQQAGLDGAGVVRRWPWRMLLTWQRDLPAPAGLSSKRS